MDAPTAPVHSERVRCDGRPVVAVHLPHDEHVQDDLTEVLGLWAEHERKYTNRFFTLTGG